jgi:hypothetical protein
VSSSRWMRSRPGDQAGYRRADRAEFNGNKTLARSLLPSSNILYHQAGVVGTYGKEAVLQAAGSRESRRRCF